jgi:hypothetical protein
MRRLIMFLGSVVALAAVVGGVLVGSGGRASASTTHHRVTTMRFRAHEVQKPQSSTALRRRDRAAATS